MALLDLARGQSFWKGMDYYEKKRVEKILQINPQLFESEVKGSHGNIYHVIMDTKQPKKINQQLSFFGRAESYL